MHVELHPDLRDTLSGQAAAQLTSACVHCGFCLATCPTYLDQRDERDSPRGRIYLIKQVLETGEAGSATQTHLDRCLTCRSCETTCPSGMQYGQLLDIGRELVEQRVARPALERVMRRSLRYVLTRPRLFKTALIAGQLLRPVLPRALREKVPARQSLRPRPATSHKRRMLVLEGCVQSAATPATNIAARRVLDKLGITLVSISSAGCCGAVNYHLSAHDAGLDDIRRNIDAWWQAIENGAEAIISSASGCSVMLADYGKLLQHDSQYADKAARVSALALDISQVLVKENLEQLTVNTDIGRIAVQTPCSLQHGLQQPELIREILRRAGFSLAATREDHLCCGSAGTYSILQAKASERLRDNKISALTGASPTLIATANVGCQLHLQQATALPVRHWLELLDP
jgi:glycolate oxidase iron-sulfur subunit